MSTRISGSLLLCFTVVLGVLLAGCGGGGRVEYASLQNRIYYQGGRIDLPQLYSIGTDGQRMRQLTSVGTNVYPSVTSDGQSVVFASSRTGISQVFIMSSDGNSQRQLTTGSRPASFPAISGDGSRIVFMRSVDAESPTDIYIMDSDGSNVAVVPNTTGGSWPALNHDASKIVFVDSNRVFVMNIDGSNRTEISATPRTFVEAPKFSGDGSKILYAGNTPGHRQIVLYDLDGAVETIVTDDTNNNRYPCFSSDGSKIYFCRLDESGTRIYRINLDGTGETELVTGMGGAFPACPPQLGS